MLKLVRLHAAYVCGFQLSKILMISLVGLNHTGGHNYIAFPGIFTQRARFASSAVELPCARVCVSMNVCLPFAFYLRNMTSTHGTPMCVWVLGGCACVRVRMSNQTNPRFICCGRSVCHIHRELGQTDGEPRPRPRPACIIYGHRWCCCLGAAARQ